MPRADATGRRSDAASRLNESLYPTRSCVAGDRSMIARIWRGWTRPDASEAYAEGLRERIKGQSSMPGKIGSILLSQQSGKRCEFVTISFWETLEAIRALGGDPIEQAVFFPLDERYLIDRETTVRHFEVVGSEGVGLARHGPASRHVRGRRMTPTRKGRAHDA